MTQSMLGQTSRIAHDREHRDGRELSTVMKHIFGEDFQIDPLEVILNERLDDKERQLMDGAFSTPKHVMR